MKFGLNKPQSGSFNTFMVGLWSRTGGVEGEENRWFENHSSFTFKDESSSSLIVVVAEEPEQFELRIWADRAPYQLPPGKGISSPFFWDVKGGELTDGLFLICSMGTLVLQFLRQTAKED